MRRETQKHSEKVRQFAYSLKNRFDSANTDLYYVLHLMFIYLNDLNSDLFPEQYQQFTVQNESHH